MTDRQPQKEDSRPSWYFNDVRSNSNNRGSDEEGSDLLMVEEAKDMLRGILTMCEQEPHKKQLAKEREKAQGNPRAMMLSVVPIVVSIAEEALGRRLKHHPSTRARLTAAAAAAAAEAGTSLSTRPMGSRALLGSGPLLLLGFLEEAKLLVDTDPSGIMKRDMRSLRELLSAPP